MVDYLFFNLFLDLCNLFPLDIFFNWELHAFSKLLLRLSVVFLRLWSFLLDPRFFFDGGTTTHAKFLACLANLRLECALIVLFLIILTILVLVLPRLHLVLADLVDMFHSLSHLRIGKTARRPSLRAFTIAALRGYCTTLYTAGMHSKVVIVLGLMVITLTIHTAISRSIILVG